MSFSGLYFTYFNLGVTRSIHEATQNLGRPNKLFADAVDARQARQSKVNFFEAMEIFFDRTNRTGTDEQHTHGVVRRCGQCQLADMVLKRKPVCMMETLWLDAWAIPRNVMWLPVSISEAALTSNTCSSCLPGCIGGCDDTLKQLIEICGTGSRNVSGMPASARGRTSTTTSGTAPASNVRRSACAHCRQTRHTSRNFPSQVSTSGRVRSQGTSNQNGVPSVTCTTCGELHVSRTANTANNRGRNFYSCRQECQFFVWEDMINNDAEEQNAPNRRGSNANTSTRGGRASGRGHGNAGTFVSATGEPVRACFSCGDPSHFADACPNRG